MTQSNIAQSLFAGSAISRRTVKQFSKFAASLLGTVALCLSAYTLTVDSLIPNSKIPATYKWFLLKEVPGPRIIFESGSNSHHGINTDVLGAALGMTAINIADNAGYALEDKVARLESYARAGDVIVLPLEWSFYTREKLTDAYVQSLFSTNRDYYQSMPFMKRVQRALSLPPETVISELKQQNARPETITESPAHELFGTALKITTGHFSRDRSIGPGLGVADQSCDDYILGKPEIRKTLALGKNVKPALQRLKALKARGVDIHFAWPVLAGAGCMDDAAYTGELRRQIEAAVNEAGFEFLGTPSQSLYGQDFQDDTPYHLISKGTDLHTAQMIGFLRARGYQADGTPVDIKTFARHRLFELELAQAGDAMLDDLPIGAAIRTENLNAHDYIEFTAGWWAFEPFGRWMRDNRAMFRVTLPEGISQEAVLTVQGITHSRKTQRVDVTVNGQLIASSLFGEGSPLKIPTANLPRGEALSVFLTVPEAGVPQSPLERGENQDARSMTLHIQSLELSEENVQSPQAVAALPAERAQAIPPQPIADTQAAEVFSAVATQDAKVFSNEDLAAPTQPSVQYGRGWWEQEALGRWMKGTEASFSLDLPSRGTGVSSEQYTLSLSGDYFMGKAVPISLLIDGEAAVITRDSAGVITADFKPRGPRDAITVQLNIAANVPQSPKSMGLSDDDRTLTYFLKSVALDQAS